MAGGPAAVAGAQSDQSDLPAKCLQSGPNYELPTCTQDGSGEWTVSIARQMATDAGMDPGTATAVTLLGADGLDATSSLRGSHRGAPSPASPSRGAAERLRELQQLRDDGLVTADEYEARRRAIVDSV